VKKEPKMPKPDTTFNPEIVPPAELEKRTRRTFSAQYKRSIIELGNLLRREKLYSNQLAQWSNMSRENPIAYRDLLTTLPHHSSFSILGGATN